MLDLLGFLMAPRASSEDSFVRTWLGGAGRTRAGVAVNECSALNYSGVFCATRIICETVSCLPIGFYERLENNDRRSAESSVGDLLRHSPNGEMTTMPFREGRTEHQVNYGNGFAEIELDYAGNPVALWPIHASRVSPTGDPDKPYAVANEGARPTHLSAREVLHIPGVFPADGVWGKGVIRFARESIGGAIATDQYGHDFFGSGAQPKGILESASLKTEDSRDEFRRKWREVHTSPNGPHVAIVSVGNKYTPISLPNNDSQFLETRRFNRETIATWYRLPAYMLGEKITHANIEQASIEFVIYSIFPWVRRWEEQCNFKLLSAQERRAFYFEHNFAGLLRGDIASRYEAYQKALTMGFMSINEVRRLENMNGIGPAGDEYYMPLNMTTVKRMAQGDQTGGTTGIGSDQSGFPASSLAFDQWTRRLGKSKRSQVRAELEDLRSELVERKNDYVAVARLALVDVLGRMLTKESHAAQAAADRNEFDSWLREFYPRHEEKTSAWLETACAALRLAGVDRWATAGELAGWLRARSVAELQGAYSQDTREAFRRRLAAWPVDRAKALADEILGAAGK